MRATLALLVLSRAAAHDCGATAGARSAALAQGAAALRAERFTHVGATEVRWINQSGGSGHAGGNPDTLCKCARRARIARIGTARAHRRPALIALARGATRAASRPRALGRASRADAAGLFAARGAYNVSNPTLPAGYPVSTPSGGFMVAASEALVMLFCPPPGEPKYLGLTLYLEQRWLNASFSFGPDVEVADPLNQLDLNTTDDGALALLVFAADGAVFDAVVDAFETAAGVPRAAANLYPIAAGEVNLPLEDRSDARWRAAPPDLLSLVGRATYFASSARGYADLAQPALLVRAPPALARRPLGVRALKARATGASEFDAAVGAAYDALVDAVVANMTASGRALAQAQYLAGMDVNQSVKERCLRDPGFTVGPHPTFRGCLMNTGDCLYGLSELDVPPFGSAPDRDYVAVGVRHAARGAAEYTSLMLTTQADYEVYEHTLTVDEDDGAGGARAFLPADTPGVDDLWLVRFARACADGDAFCRVLTTDAFAADDLPYWMERAYLNPQTTIGPDEAEYVHVTVLTFA